MAVAPDSFKGSLTAKQAADHIAAGFQRALSPVLVRKIPMADGGEGTVQAIVDASGGRFIHRVVSGPRGRLVRAVFGLTGDGHTAVIEMAEASGLALLRADERDPMRATTRGTGELMAAALRQGVDHLIVGIGGSATNDGGMGMARALGVRFLDARGHELAEGGGALGRLARLDVAGLNPRLRRVTVDVACDVDNPLTGRHGAAAVYAPQKGATPGMVRSLDEGLRVLARVIRRDLGVDVERLPGAGAAGGLGAGLVAFAGGRLKPGVDIVIDAVNLRRRLRGCDLVITGEGRLDGQTVHGKTPAGVARVAGTLGIPVIAIAGSLGPGADRVRAIGIRACLSALDTPMAEEDLAAGSGERLARCAENVARLLALANPARFRLKVPRA